MYTRLSPSPSCIPISTYVRLPPGYLSVFGKGLLLNKALHELNQSDQAWYQPNSQGFCMTPSRFTLQSNPGGSRVSAGYIGIRVDIWKEYRCGVYADGV